MSLSLVFVYGSLKSGHYNHELLEHSEFVSEHTTEAKFTMVDLGAFPAVIDDGSTAIHGELYRVNEKTFSMLDKLEGHPDFYSRVLLPTQFGDAWMYVYPKNSGDFPIIESGIWNPE